METQKIVNLLNATNNESFKFATKIWYAINDENSTEYGEGNENDSNTNDSRLCDYSDAYILVTGDITATGGNEYTNVPFKNCVAFTRRVTHVNDEHTDTAENLDIIMHMYNLIEYSVNYSDTSGNL